MLADLTRVPATDRALADSEGYPTTLIATNLESMVVRRLRSLVLATKRLEQGSFRWPSLREGVMRLTSGQLVALLEGLDWARVRGVRIPTPTAVS